MIAPIGKGQRGLIVAPPKTGKTMIMQAIANAITQNNPECHLMVVLVDERPEEVTDMQRSVKGEVIASTFDRPGRGPHHGRRAGHRAGQAPGRARPRRGHPAGLDHPPGARLQHQRPDQRPHPLGRHRLQALIKPKQFFGAARKIENGGSLTILATAIVDTGSLMDKVIFEEFKGTGNMELVLDRRLANRRVFPAVDCAQSGTRKDELLWARGAEHRVEAARGLHALEQRRAHGAAAGADEEDEEERRVPDEDAEDRGR